jgi:hypothetical protein
VETFKLEHAIECQDDQIGRCLAYWASVSFGQFFITEVTQIFVLHFSRIMATKVGMCFDENGFGYILGDISQTGD